MNKTVIKHPLSFPETQLVLPAGAQLVLLAEQHGVPTTWWEVPAAGLDALLTGGADEPTADIERRTFQTFVTGETFDNEAPGFQLHHRASLRIPGAKVVHVYERVAVGAPVAETPGEPEPAEPAPSDPPAPAPEPEPQPVEA